MELALTFALAILLAAAAIYLVHQVRKTLNAPAPSHDKPHPHGPCCDIRQPAKHFGSNNSNKESA